VFNWFEEAMGPERAATLMSLLPPVGWADVATKHDLAVLRGDLAQLESRIDLRFEAIDYRFEELDQRLDLRFGAIDLRFEELDKRLDHRFDTLAATFRSELSERSDHQTKVFVGWLLVGIGVMLGTMVSAMALLV
jgi:hypothetical protein